MNPEKELETLYDHYKESCELSRASQARRNKSFIILCILEAISFLLIRNPDLVCGILNDGIRKKIENTISISNSILQTLVWILIAYCLMRYIQDMLYVERQYTYLSKIEKKISDLTETGIFDRESDNYLRDYPIVLNLIDLFYKMFSPVLFMTINIIHMKKEWKGIHSLPVIMDLIICIAIVIITWFYFFEIHNKITECCKKYIPCINCISSILHEILKEV